LPGLARLVSDDPDLRARANRPVRERREPLLRRPLHRRNLPAADVLRPDGDPHHPAEHPAVTLLSPHPPSEAVLDGSATLRDAISPSPGPSVLPSRWRARLREARGFLLVVVAPTVAAAFYYFAIAASQYESEAHFVVKTAAQSQSAGGAGLAEIFGLQTAVA